MSRRILSCCLLVGISTLVGGSQILQAQSQDQLPVSRPHSQKNLGKDFVSPRIYQKWLDEDVVYIVTDLERADFQKLTTAEQCDKFVEDFWERRNPNPGSPENAFKAEHYRRIAYTNNNFAAGVAGWKTDRGRIYITYGPPDEREQHPGRYELVSAPDTVRFPSDIWRYHHMEGIGNDVTVHFTDKCRCGEYRIVEDPAMKHPAPSSELSIRLQC